MMRRAMAHVWLWLLFVSVVRGACGQEAENPALEPPAAEAPPAEPPPTPAPASRSERGSALVTVTFDRTSAWQQTAASAARRLLESHGLLQKAMRHVEGGDAAERESLASDCRVVEVKPAMQSAEDSGAWVVEVLLRDKAAAELTPHQVIAALGQALQAELERQGEPWHRAQDKMLAQLTSRLEEFAREINKKQDRMFKLLEQLGMSNNAAVSARVQQTLARLDETNVTLLGLEARKRALESQIAKLGVQAQAQVASDPVARELEKVVRTGEALVATSRRLQQANEATEAQVLTEERELAQARAELARARQAAALGAGGKLLGELQRRLVETSIEQAEAQGRVGYLEELNKSLPQPHTSPEVEFLKSNLAILDAAHQALYLEIQNLETRIGSQVPPMVSVLPL